MNKRKLAKIPAIEAGPEAIELAYNCNTSQIVEAYLHGDKKELLTLYIFNKLQLLRNNLKAEARIFINKTDYITQSLTSQHTKWYIGSLTSFVNRNYLIENSLNIATKRTKEIIGKYFDCTIEDKEPFKPIYDFQNKICKKRLEEKYQKITKPIDALMDTVPKIPKSFFKWVENKAMIRSRYIYYKYLPRVRVSGFCTHCKNEVEIYKPRHNNSTKCPNCKSKVILKSIGKSKMIQDCQNVCLLQVIPQGFIARYFHIRKNYYEHYKEPKISYNEVYRDFYDINLNKNGYEYGLFMQKSIRWINARDNRDNFYDSVVVYPSNIKSIQEIIPYSGLDKLVKCEPDFDFKIYKLINDYKQGIFIAEKLAKVGLFRLARSYLNSYSGYYGCPINKGARKLNKLLQIENDDVKVLISANINYEELELFRFCRNRGTRLTVEQIIAFRQSYTRFWVFREIAETMPIGKTLKYLSGIRFSESDILYRDYINSCKELDYDLRNPFIAFPKNLKERHNQNVETINQMSAADKEEIVNSRHTRIEKIKYNLNKYYSFESKKYFIRAPENAGEIISEGHKLHHCVGGQNYLREMAYGRTVILFLRKKEAPNVPFYTIEIKENNLIQCHTFGNKDKGKNQIQPFLAMWQKYLDKKIGIRKKQAKAR